MCWTYTVVVYDMLVLGLYNIHVFDLLWYSVGRGVRYTAGDGGQYRDLSHQHPRLILPAHRQVRVKNIITKIEMSLPACSFGSLQTERRLTLRLRQGGGGVLFVL